MSEWMALCGEKDRVALARALRSCDPAASVEFVGTADALRRALLEAVPNGMAAAVGPLASGVSDVNLAAAIAQDGNARSVALVRRDVTGSLRSRAARAGIDYVIELSEHEGAPERGAEPSGAGPAAQGRLAPAGSQAPLPAPLALAGGAPDPGGRGAVVTLCSGRGGVGKTLIAALAAAHAARWGMRVRALDLDLSCGNLYSCFALPGGSDLARLADEGEVAGALARIGADAAPGLSVFGPCERPEEAELVAPLAGRVISELARGADLVIVDTSPTFTDAVAQAAQASDRLVIVSDGRPGSLASLARTSGLAVRLGVARTRIARVENRANPRERADLSLGRAEVGLEAARVFRVFEGGAEAEELLGAGRAVELAEEPSALSDSVATMIAQVLAELGSLPDCEEARRAAEGPARRRGTGLLGLLREAR